MKKIKYYLFLVLSLSGCGIKGPLTPPTSPFPRYAVSVSTLSDITGEPNMSGTSQLRKSP